MSLTAKKGSMETARLPSRPLLSFTFTVTLAQKKTLLVVRSGERIIKPCGLVCCVAILCPVASVALLVALCSLPRLSSRLCCHRRYLNLALTHLPLETHVHPGTPQIGPTPVVLPISFQCFLAHCALQEPTRAAGDLA